MNIAIYVRVSTDQQAEKGYSIDTQLEACRKTANEFKPANIVEFIDNGYSGEYLDRPDMDALREGLKNKEFDKVVIYDPDRLARNLLHQLIIAEEIDKSGAELKFVVVNYDQSPDGKFMFGIRGLLSELEKEKIKERTMRGKKGKLAKGKIISNMPPYGYDYDHETSNLKINEEQAKIVRMIFDWCIDNNWGCTRIADELNIMDIPTSRGAPKWISAMVYRVLSRQTYTGQHPGLKHYHKKTGIKTREFINRPEDEWILVNVPAIVTIEQFETTKSLLTERKNVNKRNTKQTYLIQGIGFCGKCGRRLSIKYGPRGKYYVCMSYKDKYHGDKCNSKHSPCNVLDEVCWQYIFDLCRTEKTLQRYIDSQQTPTQDEGLAEKLDKQIEKLIKQSDTITNWFRRGKLKEDIADKQLDDIQKQLDKLYERKQGLNIISTPKRQYTAKQIKEMMLSAQTPEDQKEILNLVVSRLEVEKINNSRKAPEYSIYAAFR